MQLSVIIPVKNEMSNIKAVYKSIFNSNYKNKEVSFETIPGIPMPIDSAALNFSLISLTNDIIPSNVPL